MNIKTMYKHKIKRPVDPNAPPRPNLMSHDKVIRDQKVTIEQQQQQIQELSKRISALESKLNRQTDYLNAVHQQMIRRSFDT